jgi:hypothetical protein
VIVYSKELLFGFALPPFGRTGFKYYREYQFLSRENKKAAERRLWVLGGSWLLHSPGADALVVVTTDRTDTSVSLADLPAFRAAAQTIA